ncbi:HNH/ENDO VII family nuclease [Actinacidiphila acidipaludis]|uniref:Hint domain-containing protein n=1 Tax=Actinacidiphila acidipaludis TaxID=2873382 RepID=A0ABS7QF37_9ACTN|nr:HNH/ENDO VII family nuclease [Streptomyces acidipaludis]MBY8881583.1 hypothetical protein [Streptomyces acidipaludis]
MTWDYHGLRAASDVLVTKGQFMSWRGGKRRTRLWVGSRWVTMLAVGAVLVASGTAWADVTSGHRRYAGAPDLPQSPSVGHVTSLPSHFVKPPNDAVKPYRATATHFPPATSTTVALTSGTKPSSSSSPISIRAVSPKTGHYAGPATATVKVSDPASARQAGVSGVLFTVTPHGTGHSAADVTLDYSAFAQAYGGNFGSRLELVQLPTCALTTPQKPECRVQTPLASKNTPNRKTLQARVNLTGASHTTTPGAPPHTTSVAQTSYSQGAPANVGTASSAGVVLAATTSASSSGDGGGPSGTYSATSLSPSGSWTGGGSSGAFTYSYPVTVPPTATQLTPTLSLGYNSAAVDGQTAATQSQGSWVGDGWATPQSFIEQSFTSCSDNPEGTASPVSTSDECYDGPVLTMSLNGSSMSLIWDSSKKVWKPEDDNGEVVTHLTDQSNGTGTYNTDYWTVTSRDGTTYEFGRNELPGWSSGKTTTNSVDSMPVYSAHSTDPCYNSAGFTSSVCTMAYRWNLDYVKDLNGAAMSYYYKQDTNYYGQDNGAKNSPYVRDSHLDHIDYGFTDGNAYGTIPDKVNFTTADRCVTGTCDPLNSTTKANWPDVPFDLVCASGATCASHSPAFFSTVMLTTIATQQWSASAAKYLPVDSWALNVTLPTTGDGNATTWLSSITRTGQDASGGGSTTPIALPPVTFASVDLQNRVDTATDGLPPLYRFRVSSVTTEAGSVIGVQYGQTTPCTAPVTISPAANTSSCYPVYWTPKDYTAQILDWFNKYEVDKVTQTDPTGGAPTMATSYKYTGAAWHFDDNELVKPKYRTYGQFRGYQDVKTFTGDNVNDKQTLNETTYYQGMSDDNNTTAVMLTDSQGGKHEDLDQLAGGILETTGYVGNGGSVDHSTITSYWVSDPTATRTRTGLPALTANSAQPVETWTRQALTDGGTTTWRTSETDTSYDATITDANFGQATAVYTHSVPVNAAYDRCTTTSYAPANTDKNLVGLAAQTETDTVACAGFSEGSTSSVPGSVNTLTAPASVSRPAQVVSASRTFYDDPTMAATWPQPSAPTFPQTSAPTLGTPSVVQIASGYTGGAFTWQTSKTQVLDSYGRPTDAYDAKGNKTTVAYTDSAGSTTGTAVKNPLNQTASTTLDPARGLTLTGTDPNTVLTTTQYDPLGRQTAVWLNSRATTSPANYTYSYLVSNSGVTAVTTNTMNDAAGYATSTTIYDALLRVRQTQTPTPKAGRMVTDTFYDTRGWKSATYNGWWDSATGPNTTIASAADLKDEVPNQDYFTYDGLGRVIIDQSEKDNVEITRTTTVYNGDRTTVIPPDGGVTKSTVTDPMGRTKELDEYTAAPTLHTPTDTFTGTWYTSGGTTQATTYGFDSHGNQNSTTAGGSTWTNTYNILGQITNKQDPDAGASSMLYDANGNLTQTTDARGKTTSYTYDALNRKLGVYDAPSSGQTTANETASWVYDNANNAIPNMRYPIGHATTQTAYNGGAAYVTQARGFNVFGESIGESITIPSSTEGAALGKTYTFSHAYSTNLGLPSTNTSAAAGGLPLETVNLGYQGPLDLPDRISGTNGYDNGTAYDAFGRVQQETLGAVTGNQAWITNTYDDHAGWLKDQLVTRSTATPKTVDEQAYDHDKAGNITRQVSTRLGSATTTETQCYQYDALDRLTQAWTATDSCTADPSTGSSGNVGDNLSPASAYWTKWTIDALGNRTKEIDHSTTGAADTSTDYAYDGNSANQPHTLTSTDSTGGTNGSTAYAYDADGNMTIRTTPGAGTQDITWNDQGRLTSITGGTKGDSHFVYDANGDLLLQKDPGTTTLYLPGEQLALNTATGQVDGTRYYPLPGGGTAVRIGNGAANTSTYSYEIPDQHGTNGLSLDATAQNPTWRQSTPYGAPRGTTTTWADNRGFLNAPTDTSTALTIIGARQYDTTTGRFISLDPLIDTTDPQSLSGYGYADNNPMTFSDPTGTKLACGGQFAESCPTVDNNKDGVPDTNQDTSEKGGTEDTCPSITNSQCPEYAGDSTTTSANTSQLPTVNIPPEWTQPNHGYGLLGLCWFGIDTAFGCVHGKAALNATLDVDLNLLKGLSGYDDFVSCSNGSWKGCSWSVIDGVGYLTAAGKLAGVVRDSRGVALVDALAGCSFSPETQVLMAHGQKKSIDKIKIGDKVEAADPKTGKHKGTRTVTAALINHDYGLIDVTIQSAGDKPATIHTTSNHPFWDDTTHTWTLAGQLKPGDLLNTDANLHARVITVRATPGAANRYNLTVAQLHTYYVLAGSTPVLVHNSSCQYWSLTEYKGQRIYQRDDLVNPDYYSPADKYGRSNLKRMQQGLAPMGPDDKPLNLHHMLQTQDGPIAEVTSSMHFGNYSQLHWKVGTNIPSGIDRDAFNAWKSQYWKNRAAGFGG